MIDKINSDFKTLQNSLALRQERHEILAGNIANADTPNFKAKDFDFSAALSKATAGQTQMNIPHSGLAMTSERHLPGTQIPGQAIGADVQYRVPFQTAMDGNTVEMDVERIAFAENTLQQQANISFINAKLRTMNAALQNT